MKQSNMRFNYHDYLQLPEDKRYEILDGELYVVPTPNIKHQRVSRNLVTALHQYTRIMQQGELFDAPCDVVLSEENVVQPDILLIRKERFHIIGEANILGAPDLVVEILSPNTQGRDREVKRKVYARFGVLEYWVVDPDAETVEVLVWSESGYEMAAVYDKGAILSSPLLPELQLPLSEIFP